MSSLGFGALATVALLLMVLAGITVVLLLSRARSDALLARRFNPVGVSSGDEFDEGGQPWLQNLARSGRKLEGWVDPDNESARLLTQAGWKSAQSRVLWYAFQASIPVAGALLVLLFWIAGPEKNKALMLFAYAFAAFALSILVPRWILRGAAAGRRERLKAETPLFIHLMVLLFEAGLSTRQAFASIVREGGGVLPELGREFDLVLRQLEAGADLSDVLKNLSDTLEVEDLTHVLGVLRQVDRYGGEVREPLLETLGVLEQRRSLDLREKVNLMSGRMTIVMVLFFFPALLIFVAGPAFLSIIRALAQVSGTQ